MMGGDTQSTHMTENASALTTRMYDSCGKKGRPWCDHCKKPGHLHEKCWKLHGKPGDRKPSKFEAFNDHHGNHVTSKDTPLIPIESNLFSPEQMEALQKMFSQKNHLGNASVTHKGKTLLGFSAYSTKRQMWIVDFRAANHMTGDVSLFQQYSPCRERFTIKIADGSISKVAGMGSIVLSPYLTLHSVLYIPNLDCNLLSMSKLSWDLNCIAKFVSNLCEFQYLDSGRTIGNGKMHSGLYLLQVDTSPTRR